MKFLLFLTLFYFNYRDNTKYYDRMIEVVSSKNYSLSLKVDSVFQFEH
jgi:hypothetical protein